MTKLKNFDEYCQDVLRQAEEAEHFHQLEQTAARVEAQLPERRWLGRMGWIFMGFLIGVAAMAMMEFRWR